MANLRWGIGWGLAIATLFSVYVAALDATRGSAPFDRLGVSLGAVVALYMCGGFVSGAIVGALRPFGATRGGAILVGIIATLPVSAGALFVLNDMASKGSAIVIVGYAVLMGSFMGNWVWKRRSRVAAP